LESSIIIKDNKEKEDTFDENLKKTNDNKYSLEEQQNGKEEEVHQLNNLNQESKDSPQEENYTGNVSISYKTMIFFFSKAGYLMFIQTVLFLTFMQLGRNFIELFLADWLKNEKSDLNAKLNLQQRNMKYYALFVVLHTIATIGRSAFFAINFLNAAEKIYKMTIEKFIFAKIKCLQKFNIGFLTNL